MKIYKIIFILIFFLILLVPVVCMNLNTEQISEIDNSKLPEISSINNLNTFENYISKRLGFRTQIINTYTIINDKLFNKMVHPSYTYGTNGYVFFKTRIETHDNNYLDTFANLVKNMQDYVTQRGSYFLFILNPTKISVYSQYLPKGYNFTNYRVNYLKQKLDELKVNYIDNTECLINASETKQVYNRQYDAGHWNDIGAFYGINNIYDKMQKDGINISKLDINDYIISSEVKTSLPVSEFSIHEEIPIYNLKEKKYLIKNRFKNSVRVSKTHRYFNETINPNVDNNSLLFFRGSYMTDKEKFVSNKFSHAYFVENYDNSINFDYYYNITNPDIVLFETVEYAIKDNYYSSKKMKAKKYNKLYDNFKNLKEGNILTNVKTNEIMKKVYSNLQNNVAITEINIDENNFEYAYLQLDNNIYDFCYEKNHASIAIPTELLNSANDIKIIVVSKNCQTQQHIKIK